MSSDKLNKVASLYNAARAISDKGKVGGSAEEMEELAERKASKSKRGKKLVVTDEEAAEDQKAD